MKKTTSLKLCLLVSFIIWHTFNSFGQTIFSEDFEGALDGGTGLPTGWTETGLSTDGIFSVGTDVEANAAGFWPVPAHTMFAQSNDDVCDCDKSADRLIMPAQDFSAVSGTLTLNFSAVADDVYAEFFSVEVSIDGGANWTSVYTLPLTSNTFDWQNLSTSLTAYVGMPNVMISFLYNDQATWGSGMAIDDVSLVVAPPSLDLAITALGNLNEYTIKPVNQGSVSLPIDVTIENLGSQDAANYTVQSKVYLDPDFVTPLQTYTYNGTNLMVGNTNVINQGSYSASGVGNYVIISEIILPGDVDSANDSMYNSFEMSTYQFARDLGNASGGLLGVASGTELIIGQTFTFTNAVDVDSILFLVGPSVTGGTITAQISTMNGGLPDETNYIGQSAAVNVSQAIVDEVTANGYALINIPITSISSGGTLNLSPGTYFFGVKQSIDADNMGLVHSNGIVTANTAFYNVNGGAYTDLSGAAPNTTPVIRIFVSPATITTPIELDFSNPADWVMGNDAGNSDNWVVGTTVPSGSFAIAGIASTTAANGFALFDSDLLCSGDQSAWIGNAMPIDLSSFINPRFEFESFYRKYTDQIFLQVSTDNLNWTNFQVHSAFTGNEFSSNPEAVGFNIGSAIAGNPSTVYFRFYFLSGISNGGDGCDYAWMVDDIAIIEAPSYDLELTDVLWGSSSDWGTIAYPFVPSSQVASVNFGGIVKNNGGNSDDATFTASTTGYAGVSPLTTLTVNEIDTLYTGTDFTSSSVSGTINTISFNVSSSNAETNLADNTLADETITITPDEYGVDKGTADNGSYNSGEAFELGNIFNIYSNTTLTDAVVNIHGLANPGATIYARLYQVDPFASAVTYLDYFSEIYTSATTHTITAGDLDAWVTIPFDVPQTLTAGNVYALVIGSNGDGGATNDFVCNTSGGALFGSSIYYDIPNGAMLTPSGIPMVRMKLQDLTVTISSDDIDNMACTGQSITLTSSMAAGNVWSTGATTQSITVSANGTYSVVNGGNTSNSITLTFDAPALNVTSTDVNCNGACDGTATANLTDMGFGAVSLLWSNGNTVANPTGLCPATYMVTATDANGCTATGSATISEPPVLTVSSASNDASCNLVCDGSVNTAVSGGTGLTTYLWSNGSTSSSLSNLCAGTYSVTVTDANGCTAMSSATVSEPSAITLNTSSTDLSCNGTMDGSVSSTATGGTGTLSYMWSNGITTDNQSGLAAGTYSVTATDDNGCSATASATVSEPSAIIAGTSSTNSSCGNNDGSASVNVSGGSGGYTYSWSNGASSVTASNLSAGSYTVTVMDDSGCSVMATATVSDAGAPSLTATASDASCNNAMDGTVSSNATGGVGTISYLWSNGINTANQSGLAAGTYSVTVTDDNGCSATSSVTINEPLAIIANTSATNSSCGNNDGSASVNASGGTGGFTYSWSNGANSATASNLSAGSYTVTVMDNSGCSIMATATVSDAGAPSITASASDASCNGLMNGTVSSNATGGVGSISYMWSNGVNTANQSGLAAGTYAVTATDDNGCSATASVTVSEPSAIIANTSSTNSTCGNTDGSAMVVVSGGTGGYSYIWSNGDNTANATNLTAGSYSVMITDNSGCSIMASASVSDAGAPSLTASATDASCNGTMDGSVSSNATGGTGTISYLWSNGISSADQSNLAAGTYSVTVTDDNGCSATASVTISEPSAIVANTSSTNSSCGNNDGSASVVTSGGSGGYTYSWSNGATTATVSNLSSGFYTVTVMDNSACSVMAAVTVSDAGAPGLTASASDASCNGAMDGSVSSNVTGGVGTISYMWSNGVTTANQTGLSAGTYSIVVTDDNGCSASTSVTISEPSAIIANASSTNSSCGNSDGSVSVIASGGSGGFTYSWSNGASTSTVSNLASGSYSVTVMDNSGCSVTATATVSDAGAPSLAASASNVSCNGLMNGTVSSNAVGGTGTISYMWSNGVTTPGQTGLTAGTYTVTATDDNGCSATATVTISEPSAITAVASSTNSTCGNSDGSANVTATGGTGGYLYSWSNGATTANITNLSAGSYSVTVIDNSGCSTIALTSVGDIGAPAAPSISSNDPNNSICEGESITLTSSSASMNVWSTGETSSTINVTASGIYTLSLLDNNGCQSTAAQVTIVVNSLPNVNAGADQSVCLGESVALSALGALNYIWNNSVIDGVPFTPSATLTYTVIGMDANGCENSDDVTVTVKNLPPVPTISLDSDNHLCGNETVTLTASTGTNVEWSTNETTQAILVSNSGTYTVTRTGNNGCQSTSDPVIITASANPVVDGGADQNICDTALITLSATGALSYTWTNGVTNDVPFTPSVSGTYTVTGTDANGCQGTDDVLITLNNCAGLDENTLGKVNVYPNPSSGIFTVSIDQVDLFSTFTVTDQIGKKVSAGTIVSNHFYLDMNDVSNGIYYLTLYTKTEKQLIKLEVVK